MDLSSPKLHKYQVLFAELYVTLIVSMITLTAGFSRLWVEATRYQVPSEQQIDDVLTDYIPFIVGVTASSFFGIMVNSYGRKSALYFAAIFVIKAGLILLFTTHEAAILFSGILSALCDEGTSMIVSMYVCEVVQAGSRGFFISTASFPHWGGVFLGQLSLIYCSPHYVQNAFIVFVIAIPSIFLAFFVRLPESPYFLVSKNKIVEAEKSIAWLRCDNEQRAKNELKKIIIESDAGASGSWPYLSSRGAKRGLIIALVLYSLDTLGQTFATISVQRSPGPYHQPNVSLHTMKLTLLDSKIPVVTIISFLFGFISDFAGRKVIMLCSLCGISLTFLVLFVYTLLGIQKSYSHTPIIFGLYLFVIFRGMSTGTLCKVISLEVTSVKTRYMMISATQTLISCLSFIAVKSNEFFDIALPTIYGIQVCVHLLGLIFVWWVVPETKGRTLNDIANELDSSYFISKAEETSL